MRLDSIATCGRNSLLAWDSTEAAEEDAGMSVRTSVLLAAMEADLQAIVRGFGPRGFVACLARERPRSVGRGDVQGAPRLPRSRGCCKRETASLGAVGDEGEG